MRSDSRPSTGPAHGNTGGQLAEPGFNSHQLLRPQRVDVCHAACWTKALGNDLAPLGIHNGPKRRTNSAGCRGRDGLQGVDAQDFGPDGIGEHFGGGHADPQPGERAGPDRNGHQLNVLRAPADLSQQGLDAPGPATGRFAAL